ncbi:MAG: endo-1,4-beta-xylanase [Spirulina sp.]
MPSSISEETPDPTRSNAIYPPAQNLLQQAKYTRQAKACAKVLNVALALGCKSFNLWGFSDRHSTPCTFDADFQPKPAYFALENTLQRSASTVLQP